MHAQIVSDALGVPYADVEVMQPDTSLVADSGPTVASRTCMVVGKILEECAEEMRGTLGDLTPAEYHAKHGGFSVERQYEPPGWIAWDDNTYRGTPCDLRLRLQSPARDRSQPSRSAISSHGGAGVRPPIHPNRARTDRKRNGARSGLRCSSGS